MCEETAWKQPLGSFTGQSIALRVEHAPGQERFFWLGAAPRGQQLLVLEGECGYERREIWEAEFRRLAATLRFTDRSQ